MNKHNFLSTFVRKKPTEMLLAISNENGNDYCGRLAVKAGCTYSYASDLLEKMEGIGLLTIERQGRTKRVKLTNKGINASKILKELMDIQNYP